MDQSAEKHVRQSISFPPSILAKARTQAKRLYPDGNLSRYIRELIESDLESTRVTDLHKRLLDDMQAVINRYSKDIHLRIVAEDPAHHGDEFDRIHSQQPGIREQTERPRKRTRESS